MATAEATRMDGKAAARVIIEGGTFKDAVGLTDGEMEVIYTLAYNQYSQQQFAEAEKTFRVLLIHDHLNQKFWMGLGATRQKLQDFEGALVAYSMIAELGGKDPRVPLHAAECFMALGMYDEAMSGLEAAAGWLGNADDRDAVLDHIEILFNALEQLAAQPAEAGSAGGTPRTGPSGRH